MTSTPNKDTLHEQVRNVKLRLRGVMNGITSTSMREKGLTYKVNFGVELPRLREMAEELPHTYHLAAALWKEDIRECKILAAYLQPVESFYPEIADIWMEQIHNSELADYVCMALFRRLPYASQKAFQWIASGERMTMYTGFRLMTHLFATLGTEMNERSCNEFVDQAQAILQGDDLLLKQAARSALDRYTAGQEE